MIDLKCVNKEECLIPFLLKIMLWPSYPRNSFKLIVMIWYRKLLNSFLIRFHVYGLYKLTEIPKLFQKIHLKNEKAFRKKDMILIYLCNK